MKRRSGLIFLTVAALTLANQLPAQTNAATDATVHTNTAIIPVERPDQRARARTEVVLKRAKDNPGPCDIAFIGDSITQNWEGPGKNIWNKYYGDRKCLNLGVGGDRTQHVLWRFEHGQLDGIKPKVAVVMIGTNNSNKDDNSEADILEGVTLIVKQIRERLPDTKIILNSIFPRGKTFSTQRGKILQANQALERLADNKNIFWVDFGYKLIEDDGSITREMMHDALHPGEKGYVIWAEANEPLIKQFLAEK